MINMQSLVDLLRVDEKIRECEREIADIPKRKEQDNSRLAAARNALATAQNELKKGQARVDELELEVKARQERVTKLRQQQMGLKTNKEFKAMDAEIATVLKEIDGLENRLIEAMDSMSPALARVEECETQFVREKETVGHYERELDERLEAAKAQLAIETDRRKDAVSSVAPDLLRVYERLLPGKWPPLAALDTGGVCGGCHMNQPPATPHAVRRKDALVMCHYCGRMLY